jgi:hypothetical protein
MQPSPQVPEAGVEIEDLRRRLNALEEENTLLKARRATDLTGIREAETAG